MKPLAEHHKPHGGRERVAPRAAATSDVTRPRAVGVAALAGALAAGIAAVALPAHAPESAPGPLARPHVQAKLTCASCHDASGNPADACAGCHGTARHASVHPSHRALAASGELGCAVCHPAHGDARGVTFAADGTYVAWARGVEVTGNVERAAPAGATVPLVPLTVCGRCHRLTDARDPIATCRTGASDVATCFGEHQRADAPPQPPRSDASRCERQHDSARFVAWDAARDIVHDTPAPNDASGAMPWAALAIALGTSTSTLFGLSLLRRARRNANPLRPAAPLAPSTKKRLPQIDPSTCLGCYACVDACPFDVLEIEKYVAVVARAADCCGVVLCEQVCPNGSLTIREEDAIADGLNLDEHLESRDAPGVFVAGDLSGLPLIKNAIAQGRRVIDRIDRALPREARARHRSDDRVDVVIVGAGPAGLSASLRARELGLSYMTLEQGTVASSIQSFPRDKLVFDQPLQLPVEGELWLKESTKEELLAQWARIVRTRKLAIREGQRVESVEREGSLLAVRSVGPDGTRAVIRAARLVLAIGRRGTPRTLECDIAPEALPRVSYALADARAFAGRRVIVVGLGDTAMEAAIALARQPGTEVTVSYRGASFARGRARNISEVKRLSERGALRLLFGSRVARIDAGQVVLDLGGRAERVPFDHVFVLIGGTPSRQLLSSAGVKFARPGGQRTASGATP